MGSGPCTSWRWTDAEDVVTKTRKGLPFIKFELPKRKKPDDKQASKPDKPKPTDRLTSMALGEEAGSHR